MDGPLRTIAELLALGGTQAVGLIFARLLPIVALTPLFGGEEVPRRFRFGLTLAFAVALAPVFAPALARRIGAVEYGFLLAKEAIVGLSIAVGVLILFELFAAVGALVDAARDATIATVLDPLASGHSSVLAVLLRRMVMVVFVSVGGYRLLLGAVGESFAAVPPGTVVPDRLVGPQAAAQMIGLLADLIVVAVKLATPVIVLMLAAEVAVGLVGRAAAGFDVFFLARTAKPVLGLLVFLLLLGHTFERALADLLGRLLAWLAGYAA